MAPENGCAVHDMGLNANNSISGKVWDERGQPVKNANVGLVDFYH